MTFTPEQIKLLNAKLDMAHVKPPTANGPKGDYLEGWHVIAEANRIFGFDGWSYEIYAMNLCGEPAKNEKGNWAVSYLARIKVEVGDVRREDVGYGSGFAKNIGDAYESASKEAVTDALKRCLRTFGNPFGLALYDKTRANVSDPEEIARQSAIDSLWQELCALSSAEGLKSFWIDNSKAIANFDEVNRARFTKKKDELKAKFDADKDVAKIQEEFPGARVTDVRRIDDTFPGDLPFTDEEVRRHPMNAG